jgi:hypothetical protein
LFDLVRFRVPTLWLQVQDLFDSFFREDVMATTDARIKAKASQQLTESFEWNISVRGATQYA